jgi:hypothetical protein
MKHPYAVISFFLGLLVVGLLSGIAKRPMQDHPTLLYKYTAHVAGHAPMLNTDKSTEETTEELEELLVNLPQISISLAYPNPASEYVFFNYQIQDRNHRYFIGISDVLGANSRMYPLDPDSRQLRIHLRDMAPGIYFYSLWMNERVIATRKLIVKH